MNLFHKDSPPPPSLHCTSLRLIPLYFASFTSLHFTSLYWTSLCPTLDNFSLHFRHFTSLDTASLQFSMISSTLYFLLIQLNYHFPYPLYKSLQGRIPNSSAGNWFQCWMVLYKKEYFHISVLCLLLLILPPTPNFKYCNIVASSWLFVP